MRIFALILVVILLLLGWRIISTSGEYAQGTSVDQVRIGGKSRQEAAQLLQEARPTAIEVVYQDQNLKVPPRALWQQTAKTLNQIEDPSLWERVLGGGGKHYKMIWGYNKADLRNLYEKALGLESNPVAAKWVWNGRWKISKEKAGLKINSKKLWQDIKLVAKSGGGRVAIVGQTTKPPLVARQLRQEQPTQLLVDQSEYKLYVYRQGRLKRTYDIAVGAPGFETPNGNWTIIERTVDPAWLPPDWAGAQAGILVPGGTPENPLVARWMGIGDGVGIHGTRDTGSLGSAASHGCIRMDPEEVKELYEIVPLGTPFRIQS